MTSYPPAMLAYLTDPQTWAAFFTLTVLEIVLGIDNLVFLAITSNRLSPDSRPLARRAGLLMALVLRVGLLLVLTSIAALTAPLVTVAGFDVSGRDVVLGLGGLYLLYKGVAEIHDRWSKAKPHPRSKRRASLARGHHPDHGARPGVLARSDHHRGRHDQQFAGNDCGNRRRHLCDDVRRRSGVGIHQQPSGP